MSAARARLATPSAPTSRRRRGDTTTPVTSDDVVAWLERTGTKSVRDGMARFAIPSDRAFGVTVGAMRAKAKSIGTDHALAETLWQHGAYESRMMAVFVDDPARVTRAQMNRWSRDFDNWAIVDTACFALFDRVADAWAMVPTWAKRTDEFGRRAAFAMIWSLASHGRGSTEEQYRAALTLIAQHATDPRNFVKKAVNMALRTIGKRGAALNAAAITTAQTLAASNDPTARWIGMHALRELRSASVQSRLGKRATTKPEKSS